MCRDPIMDIYTAHYRGEKVVLMDTKRVRENAMRVTKSRKTRINYAGLKLWLKQRFPGIAHFYAAKDMYMTEDVQAALIRNGWELMNRDHMKRILKPKRQPNRQPNQQVQTFSKLFHDLLNHCIGN